ncbi:ribosomal subunit interface protein [Sulfolobus acidocaldarius SUSAZ]|nr:ribosomal subunit interface protein [Sulfolobus acidocaldarius SUSAZ]
MEFLDRAREDLDAGELPLGIFARRDVFELENIKFWPRVWHFLGHEGEIPNPGDYILRNIGPRNQVIVVRGEDGEIRGFLNACRHRGRAFCKTEKGNAAYFRCPYHFWTYSNKGELVGVPQDNTFKINRREYNLIPVRVESYRGFLFGNMDRKAEKLEDYLGEYKWYIDIAIRGGELEVYKSPIRWIVNMNWKAPVDNFGSDSYHIAFTHRSTYQISANPLRLEDVGLSPPEGVQKNVGFSGYQFASEKGHGGGITSFYDITPENLDKIDKLDVPAKIYEIYPKNTLDVLSEKLSSEQLRVLKLEMLTLALFRIRVFPNFAFILHSLNAGDSEQKYTQDYLARLWRPVDYDKTEVFTLCMIPSFADEKYKRESFRQCVFLQGPAGILDNDDVMNWMSQTENSKNSLDLNMALKQRQNEGTVDNFPLPHSEMKVYREPSDWSSKAFWRKYFDLMLR